ncbi:related to glyoxylate/hydroxypyruvate reductase [Ustilago trichophora]|uniref:Related to glyoxylate/hydroxypyruvate reductase n=1 Tax=Ustilago trichophora TaxID=86804 RepID=A0A5C3E0A7_9BASI|nr:related to glyoxylate/hydroxypyruvate reductase [Ustilago trichophora]
MDNSAAPVKSVEIPKIVTIFERLPSKILDRLSADGRINLVTPPPGLSFAELNKWLLKELDGASAAIVWPVAGPFGQQHIAAANASQPDRFKVVSTYSVGTDAIDKPACLEAGIKVGYTPYIGDDSIAEYTIAMLLHFCRRIESLKATVFEGRFPQAMRDVLLDPTLGCGFSPMGKTVCFYGFGRIAQKTVEKLLPFGVAKILYTTSKSHPFDSTSFPRLHALREAFYPHITISNEPSLPALASQADILIVLCPGNAATNSTINSSIFSQMKPSSILINVARGTVVVNEDLEKALRANQIAAALLDVVQGEPHIDRNHPLMAPDLKERVMILPHAASTVVETRNLMADVAARNVLSCLGFEDDALGEDRERLVRERAWTHFAE